MNTINVDLSTGEALNLPIGRQGENNVTQVIFDFSGLKTEFGSGTLSLSVKRPKEYVPYAQTMTISGTDATWLVNETDTGNFGCGEIQLTYTVSGKVAKTVIYKYTVLRSIGADGEYPIPGQTWQEEIEDDIAEIKEDLQELQEEIEGGGGGGGLTADIKAALDQLALKVAYIDADGQDYYDALHNALYPPASLSRISCVYSGGSVTDRTPLSDLRADLVVTAHYSNDTTATVTAYTLSGTLVEGTSTITVAYGGKTTTFDVTVTSSSVTNPYVSDNMTVWLDGIYNTSEGHDSSATSWENLITGDLFTNTGITVGSDGAVFDGTAGHGFLGDKPSSPTTIEVVIDVTTTSTTQCIINGFGNAYNGNVTVKSNALLQRRGSSNGGSHSLGTGLHTHTFVIGTAQYVDGNVVTDGSTTISLSTEGSKMTIGNAVGVDGTSLNTTSGAYPLTGTIKCIRFYSDALTAEEVASNFAVDATRFGIS